MVTLEDRLALVRYNVDRVSHIQVNSSVCAQCSHHSCVSACPAGCYQTESSAITFVYEGCLECGTCALVCDQGSITWNYPRGGFGVSYRMI